MLITLLYNSKISEFFKNAYESFKVRFDDMPPVISRFFDSSIDSLMNISGEFLSSKISYFATGLARKTPMFIVTWIATIAIGCYIAKDFEKLGAFFKDIISKNHLNKLSKLKNGINTLLTREFKDDGVELSGGEKQKIAIARAFYKNADLIILDEPSSALDPNAEYLLNKSISEYASDKTVIFISHRLSTTRHADKIFMFDGGEIIESGSHEKLIAQNGKYAYMFNLQAEKYRK